MASAAETNLQSAYDAVILKASEVLADPKPDITVDGVTINRSAYYRSLMEHAKALRELILLEQGPFTVTSVAR